MGCEVHDYLEGTIADMKKAEDRIADALTSVQVSIASLTENLQETRRTNDRLEQLLKEARKEIEIVKTKGEEHKESYLTFKTRVYAYGSCALIAGNALGWVGGKLLSFILGA